MSYKKLFLNSRIQGCCGAPYMVGDRKGNLLQGASSATTRMAVNLKRCQHGEFPKGAQISQRPTWRVRGGREAHYVGIVFSSQWKWLWWSLLILSLWGNVIWSWRTFSSFVPPCVTNIKQPLKFVWDGRDVFFWMNKIQFLLLFYDVFFSAHTRGRFFLFFSSDQAWQEFNDKRVLSFSLEQITGVPSKPVFLEIIIMRKLLSDQESLPNHQQLFDFLKNIKKSTQIWYYKLKTQRNFVVSYTHQKLPFLLQVASHFSRIF